MQQNIFDNPTFFSRYKELRLNPKSHNDTIERPAIISLLPNLFGFNVLDLGCGHGDFCRMALSLGAASILGVDISTNMLQLASQYPTDTRLNYLNSDMTTTALPDASFDLVFSSLAIHYVEDLSSVVAEVKRLLKSRGYFVFSVEHPIYTAPTNGWERTSNGERLFWKLDSYGLEGKRVVDWLVPGVEKFHRKVETYVMELISSGFTINGVMEPQPSEVTLKNNPSLAYEIKRPPYLIISAFV